jgi:hypothetical protein
METTELFTNHVSIPDGNQRSFRPLPCEYSIESRGRQKWKISIFDLVASAGNLIMMKCRRQEELRQYVAEQPGATVREMAAHFGKSTSTMQAWLDKLNTGV